MADRLPAFKEHYGKDLQFYEGNLQDYYLVQRIFREFQPDAVVHFGLGSALAADEIVVTWPRGERERFPPLMRNQMVVLLKGKGTTVEVAN